VTFSRQDTLTLRVARGEAIRPGLGIGLFIAAHAGVFMFVHMFFIFGFREISGMHGSGPSDLIALLLEGGLWLPLAALFALRGLITVSDHVDGRPLEPAIVGFYLRIIIMQVAIIFGGFVAVFAGGSIIPLVLLIGLRTAIDLGIEPIAERLGGLTAQPERPAQGD
jgi:hypothetical protein